jgi:L-threonylcarbamoyladenylate synthase
MSASAQSPAVGGPAAVPAAGPLPAEIERAASLLAQGGLVAFPTETVYGLGADADNRAAVAAVFAVKGRPADHPLIVHVTGEQAAQAWSREIPPAARRMMHAFWPGPLALVLARSPRAHDGLTGGQDTVGLRCPAHPVAQSLLRALARVRGDAGAAIAAPSANRFGRISPTCARHVREDLGGGGAAPLVLDGGECEVGIESTIVQCLAGTVRILRPGSIGARAIEAACGLPVERPASDAEGPRASGRLEGHYAPRRPLEIIATADLAARVATLCAGRDGGAAGPRLAVLAAAEDPNVFPAGVIAFTAPHTDAAAFARVLYERLRRMDASGAARLLVVEPPRDESWAAVHDRLARAAAGSRQQRDSPL